MPSLELIKERRYNLSSLLFLDGEKAAERVIHFAEDNPIRFASTLSESSGLVLRYTDIKTLFYIGWFFSNSKISLPALSQEEGHGWHHSGLNKLVGEEQAIRLAKGIGHGLTFNINNITDEFHNFYRNGFIVHNISRGLIITNIALAVNLSQRRIFSISSDERRQKNKLNLERSIQDFEDYFDRCFSPASPLFELHAFSPLPSCASSLECGAEFPIAPGVQPT